MILGTVLMCPRCGTEWKRRMVPVDRYQRVLDHMRDIEESTVFLPVNTLAMLASMPEIANSCRWANQGYFDHPGTIEDVERRLETYERNTGLYIRSEQHLKERIAQLEKRLKEAGSSDTLSA